MRQLEIIKPDNYYHIYNRGINGEDLYYSKNNYIYFLKLYEKHITPIVETFAWCLMQNHFHFLVKIKSENELLELYNSDIKKVRKRPSQQFSNFFNAYAQAINRQNNRHGSLFEKPFRRKKIEDEKYLINLILYIHNNPVHHGITNHIEKYKWSSYISLIDNENTTIQKVIF
ncbi:hypothetical protein UMM65_06280 [Aureibaculum sp. 2210JD6-5]|uniref:hypothetical protein n=1 Tax=Aureibaculum sp. 2210JD6-5 TaxID=3103957 RepID=UPI002AAEFFD9|nr:hypothetical protein [Aureibaculum sp. 2210JD6-5]MDY7394841.1 hypothetical protein [Aureibaculum sp. 2210JD6-5]